MSVRILQGHVLDKLAELPDESVHCVCTSPPYYGLRDYKIEPQIWGDAWRGSLGLEPDYRLYVEHMVMVFAEVWRVLRKDGVVFLNLGDSYSGSGKGGNPEAGKQATNKGSQTIGVLYGTGQTAREAALTNVTRSPAGFKPKDLMMMPHRVAIALQDWGWTVRQDIVWAKPNPMPESVRDRFTKAHEYVFMLSKSPRYWFDQEAILEPCSDSTHARLTQDVQAQIGSERAHAGNKTNGNMKAVSRSHRTKAGLVDYARKLAEAGSGIKNNDSMDLALAIMPEKRNKRSVWEIGTEPFKEAHFATMPTALVEPCILAGCPPKVCSSCGAPWKREISVSYDNPGNRTTNGPRSIKNRDITEGFPQRLERRTETMGWLPICSCNAEAVPGITLDPFGGSGTVGIVADRLQRDAILIELNPSYAEMARKRISGDAPLLTEVYIIPVDGAISREHDQPW